MRYSNVRQFKKIVYSKVWIPLVVMLARQNRDDQHKDYDMSIPCSHKLWARCRCLCLSLSLLYPFLFFFLSSVFCLLLFCFVVAWFLHFCWVFPFPFQDLFLYSQLTPHWSSDMARGYQTATVQVRHDTTSPKLSGKLKLGKPNQWNPPKKEAAKLELNTKPRHPRIGLVLLQ